MATVQTFRDLRAWQQCREVRQRVRQLVKTWPQEEMDRLADQIIRSSRAATAMLAEGYGRFYEKENLRYCRMCRGELYETQDHLITAFDEGFITEAQCNESIELVQQAIRTLNGYMRYLKSMSDGPSESGVSEPGALYGDLAAPSIVEEMTRPDMER
ncbi:MAG: four helix bundle protein [Flavobacteriales bacterium]|nr:MAG: four helix bundle protein [Flavobacteriales bacterium]